MAKSRNAAKQFCRHINTVRHSVQRAAAAAAAVAAQSQKQLEQMQIPVPDHDNGGCPFHNQSTSRRHQVRMGILIYLVQTQNSISHSLKFRRTRILKIVLASAAASLLNPFRPFPALDFPSSGNCSQSTQETEACQNHGRLTSNSKTCRRGSI